MGEHEVVPAEQRGEAVSRRQVDSRVPFGGETDCFTPTSEEATSRSLLRGRCAPAARCGPAWGISCVSPRAASRADRQPAGADARAGRREDRIGQRRRNGRPGSPTPPSGVAKSSGATRCTDFARRLVHAQHLEAVEVALLRMAVLERDLAVQRDAGPITTAPSSCERTCSGLTCGPQSIAMSTRGTVILPSASTCTSHTTAVYDTKLRCAAIPSRAFGSLRPSRRARPSRPRAAAGRYRSDTAPDPRRSSCSSP